MTATARSLHLAPAAAPLTEAPDLLTRARAGDLGAFVAFAEPHLPRLRRLLAPLAGGAVQTEDLVSDAVLRAFHNLHHYEDRRFGTWLHRIAVNLAVSVRRREGVERRVLDALPTRHDRPGPAPAVDPLVAALASEEHEVLHGALAQLPERQREVLAMRFVEGLACNEIARRLETSPNAVSLVIHRAKKRLLQALEPRLGS